MFESVPNYPDSGRYWDMVDRLGITILYTAPTAIRALMKLGDDIPNAYDLSSLQLVISSGVMWSAEVKQGLLARGNFICLDSLGSSEGVGFAQGGVERLRVVLRCRRG